MDAGKSDYFISETRKFDTLLTSLGVSHTYDENDGNHDEIYWKIHMDEYINWDKVITKFSIPNKHIISLGLRKLKFLFHERNSGR